MIKTAQNMKSYKKQLKEALGTTGTMTVFRRLKALGYRTSYTHRGKYYTLAEIPEFDEQGLWDWHSVWFSRYGNLVETAREFVEQAESGFTAGELEGILHVECKRALLKLHREGRVARSRIGGVYVYLAKHRDAQRRQQLERFATPGHILFPWPTLRNKSAIDAPDLQEFHQKPGNS